MQVHLSFPAPQKHSVFDLLDLLSALVCICAFAMVVAVDYYWPSYEMGSFMSFTASVYFFGVWRKFVGCIVLLETVKMFRVARRFPILGVVQRTLYLSRVRPPNHDYMDRALR